MSFVCLMEDCIDCRWHVMKGGKLDCNFENRLRLGKLGLDQYLETEEEEDVSQEEEVSTEESSP